jgi:hypothetical protein
MQSDDQGLVRYGVVAHDDGSDRMEPVARGQWVRADEAAATIERLVAERDEAQALVRRQAEHVAKMGKRIHNQRVALRDNWQIIEMRAGYARRWPLQSRLLADWVKLANRARTAEDRARQALKDAP